LGLVEAYWDGVEALVRGGEGQAPAAR